MISCVRPSKYQFIKTNIRCLEFAINAHYLLQQSIAMNAQMSPNGKLHLKSVYSPPVFYTKRTYWLRVQLRDCCHLLRCSQTWFWFSTLPVMRTVLLYLAIFFYILSRDNINVYYIMLFLPWGNIYHRRDHLLSVIVFVCKLCQELVSRCLCLASHYDMRR